MLSRSIKELVIKTRYRMKSAKDSVIVSVLEISIQKMLDAWKTNFSVCNNNCETICIFTETQRNRTISKAVAVAMTEEKWLMYDNNTQMRLCCTIWGKVYSDAKRRDTICLVLLQPNKTIGSNFPCQQLTIGKNRLELVASSSTMAMPDHIFLAIRQTFSVQQKRLNGGNSVPIERCKNHLDNCSPRNYRGPTITEWWCYRDDRTVSSLVLIF